MKLFRFDSEVAHPVERFESRGFSISRILTNMSNVQRIGCLNLDKNGVVGFHQATCPQLFLVVDGSGWVAGESRQRIPIAAGQAAFWNTNEWHESGTDFGMRAIAIEADDLKPEIHMPSLLGIE